MSWGDGGNTDMGGDHLGGGRGDQQPAGGGQVDRLDTRHNADHQCEGAMGEGQCNNKVLIWQILLRSFWITEP